MLIAGDDLLGIKGDIHQIASDGAGKRAFQNGKQFLALGLGEQCHGLMKFRDDLFFLIYIAAANMGDVALVRAKAAANFGYFSCVHKDALLLQ